MPVTAPVALGPFAFSVGFLVALSSFQLVPAVTEIMTGYSLGGQKALTTLS